MVHENNIIKQEKTANKFRDDSGRDTLFIVISVLIGTTLALATQIMPFATPSAIVPTLSPFFYPFNSIGTLNEAGSMRNTTSPYFWLNSGGEFMISGGSGSTMLGNAPAKNKWRILYANNNPRDTDNGLHPQNLFRLVTRSVWNDTREQAQFRILADNFSASPNQNASNGLLLMSRYADDGQTLYYAGIRVDGTAVIKKKYHGVYYTMAQKKIFPGTYTGYEDNVNLLPHNTWIGLRADTVTGTDGSVQVTLSMQTAGAAWKELLQVADTGQYGKTSPITAPGFMGIRTDFMDVGFDSLSLQKL